MTSSRRGAIVLAGMVDPNAGVLIDADCADRSRALGVLRMKPHVRRVDEVCAMQPGEPRPR